MLSFVDSYVLFIKDTIIFHNFIYNIDFDMTLYVRIVNIYLLYLLHYQDN